MKAVYLVHSETSTGVVADVEALARVAKDAGALVVVDAVSSLGAVPLETSAWGLDVVVSGSQKALMAPPGLGMASVSPAALEAAGSAPRFYFDWERTLVAQRKLDAPFTPAVTLVKALDVALGLILDGRAGGRLRPPRPARPGLPRGDQGDGARARSPDDDRAAVVTTVRAPEELDVKAFLLDLRDRLGVQLIGGQGEWAGKVFRIGHIGYFDLFDITTALAAVEDGLVDGRRRGRPRRRGERGAERLRARGRREGPDPGGDRARGRGAPALRASRSTSTRSRARGDHRRLRRDRHPLGDERSPPT